MKYLIVLFLLTSCSSVKVKKGCVIKKINCDKTQCVLIFDDKSEFFIPLELLEYFKVNDNICEK